VPASHTTTDPRNRVRQAPHTARNRCISPFRLFVRLVHAAVLAGLAIFALHVGVLLLTAVHPPPLDTPPSAAATPPCSSIICQYGSSWADTRPPIVTARLDGLPQDIGRAHAFLLRPRMMENETALWSVFRQRVPSLALRTLVLDIARLRFRGIDATYPYDHRVELTAMAAALSPDPLAVEIPTYQRLLYLNALYDVALSFEGSPLVGCTTVAIAGDPVASSHPLLARNFDFETHDVFDLGKAILVFSQDRAIPVLSVAWPGLLGVVTGMNAEGVGIVVHGARAGRISRLGEPVPVTVRDALSVARDTREAVAFIARRNPMVSHMLLVADANGTFAIVERVPDEPAFVRWATGRIALTNHLEGPFASSDANLRVRARTSTLARRARADELLEALPRVITPADLAAILRDRALVGGTPLPPGDRRAIDAGIATHGVIMDLQERRIWVSEGPHLDGRFLGFSLAELLRDPDGARFDAVSHALPARTP
jgi:isopenicillin-N N-acyltransferase-like protein